MSTMQTRLGDARNWIENHRAQALAVLVLLAAIVLIIGLSLSWFVGSKSLSTVGKIQTPARLKVLGPNQTTIEPIEISYDESRCDVKNADGTVTIRRAFCVQSDNADKPGAGGQAFELQVANTTNITGLTISVYHVTVNDPPTTKGDVVGLDGLNNPYSWSKKGDPISFKFINIDETSSLAQGLANDDPTYGKYKNVQENARPLYRYYKFAKSKLDGYDETTQKANAATNFIIECTWNPGVVTNADGTSKASNVKETDMVYLIARGTNGN